MATGKIIYTFDCENQCISEDADLLIGDQAKLELHMKNCLGDDYRLVRWVEGRFSTCWKRLYYRPAFTHAGTVIIDVVGGCIETRAQLDENEVFCLIPVQKVMVPVWKPVSKKRK